MDFLDVGCRVTQWPRSKKGNRACVVIPCTRNQVGSRAVHPLTWVSCFPGTTEGEQDSHDNRYAAILAGNCSS